MKAIFITARLKSTRLKSKVLLEIDGKSILEYQIERLRHNTPYEIIVCTSSHSEDDPIENLCNTLNVKVFRGDENDVIKRYYDACIKFGVKSCYVIYGDEPFTCINALNTSFDLLQQQDNIVVMNKHLPEGTYGYGLNLFTIKEMLLNKNTNDTEVWGPLLKNINVNIMHNPFVRKDKIYNVTRLTIDYIEDLDVFKSLINFLGDKYKEITLTELVSLYWKLNLNLVNGGNISNYEKRLKKQGAVFEKVYD